MDEVHVVIEDLQNNYMTHTPINEDTVSIHGGDIRMLNLRDIGSVQMMTGRPNTSTTDEQVGDIHRVVISNRRVTV